MINTIAILTLFVAVFLIGQKVNILEHNIEAIKEWLKVLGIIDIAKLTKAVNEWKEREGE